MSALPAVTVLLPVRNGMPHLPAAVESILAQTHSDFELLVVNDGSTDSTHDWLAAVDDERLRVVNHAGAGLVAALNGGLREARYDLIARHDADDTSSADRLERQLEHLASHPDLVGVACCYEIADDDDRAVSLQHVPHDPRYLQRQLYFRNVLPHGGMLYDRRAVLATGGYRDVGAAEDYDLWVRLVRLGPISAPSGGPLYRYRRVAGSVSDRASDEQSRSRRRVRRDAQSERALAVPSPAQICRQGRAEATAGCPTAAQEYAFDHAWLAALFAARGRVAASSRCVLGLLMFLLRTPAALPGLLPRSQRRGIKPARVLSAPVAGSASRAR